MPIISRTITDWASTPYSCYRPIPPGGSANRPKSTPEDATDSLEKSSLLCRVCSAAITNNEEAISVNGLHGHVFFNPSGIAFEVRCFQRAPGCLTHGNPTTDFTWFSGYHWQYALCLNCLTHLGWRFHSAAGDSFFALIASRLIE